MKNKTIYALSSPYGISGVSIVRISGPESREVLSKLCNFKTITPRRAYHKKILDLNSQIIDKGLVIFFSSPKTFTGEDMLELHVHGSIAVIKKILITLSEFNNLRPAEPGEFSKRAHLNNKINALEAEGTFNLINAETELQRKVSVSQSFGEHSKMCQKWKKTLLEISAMVDAQIEFSEEDESISKISIFERINSLRLEIEEAIFQSQFASKIFSGKEVLIFGPPNVGKSTFFNLLIRENKSIVTEIPGTTRDQVDFELQLFGEKVKIIDSAGVRVTDERIEMLGIKKTKQKLLSTERVIMILSPDALTEKNINYILKLKKNIFKKKIFLIYNKLDLDLNKNQREKWENKIPELKKIVNVEISLNLENDNNKAYKLITESIKKNLLDFNDISDQKFFFTELRQLQHLKKSLRFLNGACNLLSRIELASEELRLALNEIECITQRIDSEEKLGIIFGKFCIGK